MTRLSYDAVGSAFSIELRDEPVVATIEVADGVLLDVGTDGAPVAIEFETLSRLAPFMVAAGGRYVLPVATEADSA